MRTAGPASRLRIMSPRPFSILALALVLAGCERPAAAVAPPSTAAAGSAPAKAASSTPAGAYALQGDRHAVLTLTPVAAGWRVSLKGGSNPAGGAAAAADCEVEAEGPLRGRTIVAKVVPFEGANLAVRAQDLAARPAQVTVGLTSGSAVVATDFQGCGVGADLSGRYVRADTALEGSAAPGPGASVADLRAAYPDAKLEVVEGYPWARFALRQGGQPTAVLTFDGENEELIDGRNSIQAIGAIVGWDALKPDLRVTKVEASPS